MKQLGWIVWGCSSLVALIYLGYVMFYGDNKQTFLIGEATHGHHQIELACTTCHTEAFGGMELIQESCVGCHAEELEVAHDSHPKKKFNDPRNADLLNIIDARYCVSCHTEHKNEQTNEMGLTLPKDYCFHCHEKVIEERESHKGLAFDSCASAGCHNYHDNRALYETFLVENSTQRTQAKWLKAVHEIVENKKPISTTKFVAQEHHTNTFAKKAAAHPDIMTQLQMDKHSQAGISCGGCHSTQEDPDQWIEKPGIEQCKSCHEKQAEGFLLGKHGMRLAQNLSAMTPAQGRLDFKENAAHKELNCNSCHSAHDFNPKPASTQACLSCHDDEHSLAFNHSPHAEANKESLADNPITCATCHMPKTEQKLDGTDFIFTQHNQNENLRPNEKMIRPVCMNCHNLEFSIDALADPTLILNNFNGKPKKHIPSIDWSLKRDQ